MANLSSTNVFGDLMVSGLLKARNLPHKAHAQFSSTDTSTDINTSSETAIAWNETVIADATYVVENGSEIVVQEDGLYQVFVSLAYDSSDDRINPAISFRVNGTTRAAKGLSGYIRAASGHNEGSNILSELLNLKSGDRVEVVSVQMGSTGTVTLRDNESVLIFEKTAGAVYAIDTLDGFTSSDFAQASHNHDASDITSGTLADARIGASSVTQHESALTITESQISDLQNYSLVGHMHAATDIDSGTFADARIAQSNVTQHEGALTITESQISDLQNYALVGHGHDELVTGVSGDGNSTLTLTRSGTDLTTDLSHTHDAADIVSGTLEDSLLPTTQSGKTFTSSINVNASGNRVAYFTDGSGGTNTSPYTFRFDEPRDFRLWAGGTNGVGDVLTAEYATGNVNIDNGQLSEGGNRVATRTWANGQYSLLGHSHAAGDVTSGTFADARISQTSVTQHEAALTITESQISDLQSYALVGHDHDGLVTGVSGTGNDILQINRVGTNVSTDLSHTHPASEIDSGTFANARIAQSNVTQHEGALTITESQISDLQSYALTGHTHDAADITSGSISKSRIPTLGTADVDFADQALNAASSVDFAKVTSPWYHANTTGVLTAGAIGSAINSNAAGSIVHIGGTDGVKVYSIIDTMNPTWANRLETTLIDVDGNATFARNITLGNSIFGANSHEIKFNQSTSYIEFNTNGARTDIIVDRVYIDGASKWIDGTKVNNWDTAYDSRPTSLSGDGNSTLTLTRAGVTNLTANLGHTHTFSELTDSIADGQVPESAVTQHARQIKVFDETGTELTY